MKPTLITPPTTLPITVEECRAYAQIDWTDDDASIEMILRGVVAELDGFDGYLGRGIMVQTWREPFFGWPPGDVFKLCMSRATSASIGYVDADNAEQTIPAEQFVVFEGWQGSCVQLLPPFIAPTLGDRPIRVWVDFTVGVPDPADVEPDVKAAIARLVAHRERHRGVMSSTSSSTEIPLGVEHMLNRLRAPRAGV